MKLTDIFEAYTYMSPEEKQIALDRALKQTNKYAQMAQEMDRKRAERNYRTPEQLRDEKAREEARRQQRHDEIRAEEARRAALSPEERAAEDKERLKYSGSLEDRYRDRRGGLTQRRP